MHQEHGDGSRFAAMIATAIREDGQMFSAMAASSSVQTFCAFESRYSDDRLTVEDPLSLIRFDPAAVSFDTETAADLLSTAHRRADTVMRGLVAAYCARKRLAIPDDADSDAMWEILARILAGGLPKLYDYVQSSETLPDATLHLSDVRLVDRLGVTLLIIAARALTADRYTPTQDASVVETSAPQHEIDAIMDEALREACERVARDRKHPIARGASVGERVFAASMNVMRTLYRQGRDQGFQRLALYSAAWDLLAPSVARADFRDEKAYRLARAKAAFEAFAAYMNELVGANLRYPGPDKLNTMMLARDAYVAGRDLETRMQHLKSVLLTITTTHATRHFVDRIADGSLRYSDIMRAMMQLVVLPLRGRPVAELPEETLDWEVLPADVDGPRDEPRAAPTGPRTPIPLDMSRIAALQAFGRAWEGSRIFRGTRTAGLAGDFRADYYVLVLPDAITGLEHAVADSPKQGRGLYVFRGEQGTLFQPPITWREAFSQARGEPVKAVGALCLRHVPTLAHNLLDALTCPSATIERRRRYLLGMRTRRRSVHAA
ncbi:hypothetical protein DSM104299_00540 [Baekduia alba]|uniref:hypothetical protein n=1 Tax=Baekduia alba TaxID=2997333 RepID=UPI0023401711|nr:hypothetical protein [Baekduia alba]WCB91862.1 hypothetical protein DSM104299_00540 [Baekduia alba]